MFIDYGNLEWVSTDSLCKLLPEDTLLPGQAFECVLACVKPAYSMTSKGSWTRKAKERLEQLCLNQELIIAVCGGGGGEREKEREREREGGGGEREREREREYYVCYFPHSYSDLLQSEQHSSC